MQIRKVGSSDFMVSSFFFFAFRTLCIWSTGGLHIRKGVFIMSVLGVGVAVLVTALFDLNFFLSFFSRQAKEIALAFGVP